MSAQSLTPELRAILNALAGSVFDLNAWVMEAGRYRPQQGDLPWRKAGGKLGLLSRAGQLNLNSLTARFRLGSA